MPHKGDSDPAIAEAVRITETERYRSADIVVISDFDLSMYCFQDHSPAIVSLRERGCRIHSVAVMPKHPRDIEVFDSSWNITAMTGRHNSRRFEKARKRRYR